MERDNHAVADTVRRYLKDCHPDGINFNVLEDEIRRNEFGWDVPVRLDREPRRLFPYFEALAEVEIALADNEQLKVLLVPAYPDAVAA